MVASALRVLGMAHATKLFWVAIVAGSLSTGLLVLTLFTRDWIELLSGVDPDDGSGATEWGVVIALVTVACASATMVCREWRKAAEAR
jgi:hypothetical protein